MNLSAINILPAFYPLKLLENDPDIESFVRTLPNADEIFRIP